MPFPNLTPSARSFTPGDWPVKQYKALSGAEVRIRYGNLRTESTLDLTFENITDANAAAFLNHYNETQGTFYTFGLAGAVFNGWSAGTAALNAPSGAAWRYAEPPQVTSVYPGRSTVQVKLIAVV
ncbi:hypothetical protein EBT31_01010 [bacterium]|jgi:hypothetical protein|nr:hypothetical protein [bacterium]